MTAYEAGLFEPPAPVVRARVLGPSSEVDGVPLLIDSGADVSAVPLSVARAAGASIFPAGVEIQLFDDRHIAAERADLAVEFMRFRFRGAFLVTESEYGVLGRNILNALRVLLDGPRQEWSLAE